MKRVLLGALAALCCAGASNAQEQMISEVRLMATNFCPRGWAPADGQILAIANHETLFSLLGTMYGGDGRTTFALPDLRGRVPISVGVGPGLSDRRMGQKGGSENVTLNQAQLPSHTHGAAGQVMATTTPANSPNPAGNRPALATSGAIYSDDGSGSAAMASDSVSVTVQPTGGGTAVPNMQPFLTMRYCIAMIGIYPSRN